LLVIPVMRRFHGSHTVSRFAFSNLCTMKNILSRSSRKIVKDCRSWNKVLEGKYCWEWRGLIVSKNRSLSSYLSTGSRNHKSAGEKPEIQMLICKPREKQDLSTRKAPRTIWVITLERKKKTEYQPAHSKSVH
jgi:hypothetical protein